MLCNYLKDKTKKYTLLTSSKTINRYNWSFWEDRALVRVESSSLYSSIVEYKFDIKELKLLEPKILLKDNTFSYEDPRLISYNDFTYVKHHVKNNKLLFMKNNEQQTKEPTWEKNWQFVDDETYIYKIKPLIIKSATGRTRTRYEMPNWLKSTITAKEYQAAFLYRLSSNVFSIDDRNFIFFHTCIGEIANYDYYQGVVELDSEYLPISYSTVPFFRPPPLNNPYKFNKNKNKCVYIMSTRVVNKKVYISAGENDCECVLYTLSQQDFVEWYDTFKDFVEDASENNTFKQNLYTLSHIN